jgi:hypothetical protein
MPAGFAVIEAMLHSEVDRLPAGSLSFAASVHRVSSVNFASSNTVSDQAARNGNVP